MEGEALLSYLWSIQSYEEPSEDQADFTVVQIVHQKEKSNYPTQS